jgi:hypothetical protein
MEEIARKCLMLTAYPFFPYFEMMSPHTVSVKICGCWMSLWQGSHAASCVFLRSTVLILTAASSSQVPKIYVVRQPVLFF